MRKDKEAKLLLAIEKLLGRRWTGLRMSVIGIIYKPILMSQGQIKDILSVSVS